MERPLINHRGPEMTALAHDISRGLKQLFGTEAGEIVLTAGSGSGAMESSLVNTVSPGERVLSLSGGAFGDWYARQARRLGAEVEVLGVEWGEDIPREALEALLRGDADHEIRAVTVVHNETSTGVTWEVAGVRRALDAASHPALLLVDVVSSLGSMEFRFDEWGVDVAVCGAQKGLMLPPGLAIVCVSARALDACERTTTPRSYYDWRPYVELNPMGWFPVTPPTSLLFGLRESLAMMQEETLTGVYGRHARLAQGVRQAVDTWDLAMVGRDPALLSNSVTAIRLPEEIDGEALLSFAREQLNLELGGGIGPLAGKAFRIGHMGWLNELEVLATLGGAELALLACGFTVELGSGVSAAQRLFAASWANGSASGKSAR
jgi:alanine-glyoxylate transaminase/serine-glyoxylate transaminase/serine-pyruvate transaminase